MDASRSRVKEFSIIWSSSLEAVKYKSYFSLPELIEFPTEIPGQKAYAYFYPPSNPDYEAGGNEKPPLLVENHGMGCTCHKHYSQFFHLPFFFCVLFLVFYVSIILGMLL